MPYADPQLEGFLDESLDAATMAAIEQALRGDAALAARLAKLVGRRDAGVHSLAGVWRRHRLTCSDREKLGSYLLGVLAAEESDYIRFHVETIGCRLCQSSLDDLGRQHAAADAADSDRRRKRYFQSSAGLLHLAPGR